jgi:hypothetical protein
VLSLSQATSPFPVFFFLHAVSAVSDPVRVAVVPAVSPDWYLPVPADTPERDADCLAVDKGGLRPFWMTRQSRASPASD